MLIWYSQWFYPVLKYRDINNITYPKTAECIKFVYLC